VIKKNSEYPYPEIYQPPDNGIWQLTMSRYRYQKIDPAFWSTSECCYLEVEISEYRYLEIVNFFVTILRNISSSGYPYLVISQPLGNDIPGNHQTNQKGNYNLWVTIFGG